MGRLADILTRARDSLADSGGTRHLDDRLIRLADDAQKDLAKRLKLLRGTTTIDMLNGVAEYDLDSKTYSITRAVKDGAPVNMTSHFNLDAEDASWEDAEGNEIKNIVLDKRAIHKIKVHPIPTDLDLFTEYTMSITYGIAAIVEDFGFASDFGIVAAMVDESVDEIIMREGITDGNDMGLVETDFGIVVDMYDTFETVKFYRTYAPTDLVDINSLLEIDSQYDVAMKFYIVGHTLRDDNDSQNRILGNDNLTFYEEQVLIATGDTQNTHAATPRSTRYNTGL